MVVSDLLNDRTNGNALVSGARTGTNVSLALFPRGRRSNGKAVLAGIYKHFDVFCLSKTTETVLFRFHICRQSTPGGLGCLQISENRKFSIRPCRTEV